MSAKRVLVVDDEASIREMLGWRWKFPILSVSKQPTFTKRID